MAFKIDCKDWPQMRDRTQKGKTSYNMLKGLLRLLGVTMEPYTYRHSLDPEKDAQMEAEYREIQTAYGSRSRLTALMKKLKVPIPTKTHGKDMRAVYYQALKASYGRKLRTAYRFTTSPLMKYVQVHPTTDILLRKENACQLR